VAVKDFIVKNGIVVNTYFVANAVFFRLGGTTPDLTVANSIFANTSTMFIGNNSSSATINSTFFSKTANNSLYLNGVDACNFVTATMLTDNLSRYAQLSGATFTGNIQVNSKVIANSSSFFVGDASANAYIKDDGLYVNGNKFNSGAGYYKGNLGAKGDPSNVASLFRINANTMTADITIAEGENAQCTGPITIQTTKTLTVQTGGRVSII